MALKRVLFNFSYRLSNCNQFVSLREQPHIKILKRWQTYNSTAGSPVYDPDNKIGYEVCKDPEEWKKVTRLLRKTVIPDPVPKDSYPSGWKPQNESALKLPYFVRRTKNHMIPVYLTISFRGMRRLTFIKHIEGDIWQFEKELREHLETVCNHKVGIRIDEVGGKLIVRGDFVYYVTEWLLSKGL